MPTPVEGTVSAILIKPIRDLEGNVVGLGELVQGDTAIVPGPLEFQDGTQQTTAYIPGEGNVTSFVGRTGVVMPQANDYSALQVSLDPTTIGAANLTATNVQEGFEQIAQKVSNIQGATKYSGTLGFNSPDPAKPAAGASIVPYYIFNTAGSRTVGDAAGQNVEVGDWLVYNDGKGKWELLAYSARVATAAGTTYDAAGNQYVKGADVQVALDSVELKLNNLDTVVDGLVATDYVNTFNGRTGAVKPADGDYAAVQVRTYGVGPILKASEVQGQLNQLEVAIIDLQNNSSSQDALDDHINATADAHVATAIKYAPVEGIKATNVQDAVQEVANKAIPFYNTNGTLQPIKFI